jgi:hypothetical protein
MWTYVLELGMSRAKGKFISKSSKRISEVVGRGMKNTYKILVRKSERMRPLVRSRCRSEEHTDVLFMNYLTMLSIAQFIQHVEGSGHDLI